MSPEGRRLREDTPKIDPPASPRPTALPVGVAKPAHSTRIETAGWNTIAALQPRIDPRVVEREQREALERRIAGLEALTQLQTTAILKTGLEASASCTGSTPATTRPCDRNCRRSCQPIARVSSSSATPFPLALGMKLVHTPRPASRDDDARFDTGRDLARLIEALARILASPAAAIRRLARRLASLPADTLPAPWITHYEARDWHHDVPENWNACALAQPAFRALAWLTSGQKPTRTTPASRAPASLSTGRASPTRAIATACQKHGENCPKEHMTKCREKQADAAPLQSPAKVVNDLNQWNIAGTRSHRSGASLPQKESGFRE